jgi:hypothetical protein
MFRTALIVIGAIIAICGAVGGIILTLAARGAADVTLLDNVFMSKWDQFFLVWNYNPTGYLIVLACAFGGGLITLTGFNTNKR